MIQLHVLYEINMVWIEEHIRTFEMLKTPYEEFMVYDRNNFIRTPVIVKACCYEMIKTNNGVKVSHMDNYVETTEYWP